MSENLLARTPEEQTDEMLCVVARQVFKRRDAGLDPTDFSESAWEIEPEQVIAYMEEAFRRGLIE